MRPCPARNVRNRYTVKNGISHLHILLKNKTVGTQHTNLGSYGHWCPFPVRTYYSSDRDSILCFKINDVWVGSLRLENSLWFTASCHWHPSLCHPIGVDEYVFSSWRRANAPYTALFVLAVHWPTFLYFDLHLYSGYQHTTFILIFDIYMMHDTWFWFSCQEFGSRCTPAAEFLA